MSSLPAKIKILLSSEKTSAKQKLNFSRGALFSVKTRISLKDFVNDCLLKQFFASTSHRTRSNLISLTILVKTFHSFNQKLEQLSCKKMIKFALLGDSFSSLFNFVLGRFLER